MSAVYIIAEAGVNHNGDADLAFKLIDVAVDAGVDAVKFQTFKASNLVSHTAEKAGYQKANTGTDESQLQMLQRLELSYEVHHQLIEYCHNKGIDFLSTAFDFESLTFLSEELKLKQLKIPSGELTNAPLVLAHARTGCSLILSTGMATLADIELALGVIAFGMLNPEQVEGEKLTAECFSQAYYSAAGRKCLRERVTLLHCTTEYPAPPEDINLKAMDTLSQAFDLPVGYSDHSQGICVAVAAVARGAKVIEKHFTLDKTMAGPDHQSSLEPDELKDMQRSIRVVEQALGDGIKGPRPSEIENMNVARKSLVAAKNICVGDIYTADNLAIKRPGGGLAPINYWKLLGGPAKKACKAGELISD
ncbi:N-acetylneuraminate synthase [Oceanicoccus sp. KOV_DT_Chl]|uniref:N-acetylneuraminate synthase n=1 Tax=Oceanicoccus sp. KOV_DT_Chl TaxID=1904639 RepID=UPI000C7BE711|nr:N-acetylneuraminate synthase [Oceanicoccus sp. KOV_DT_Chl]